MASEHDPQATEPQALWAAADFTTGRILEVGSGDGRLTFRYAKESPFVAGIDPKGDDVASALKACPSDLRCRLGFVCGSAMALPFPDETFHVALLASSL